MPPQQNPAAKALRIGITASPAPCTPLRPALCSLRRSTVNLMQDNGYDHDRGGNEDCGEEPQRAEVSAPLHDRR